LESTIGLGQPKKLFKSHDKRTNITQPDN